MVSFAGSLGTMLMGSGILYFVMAIRAKLTTKVSTSVYVGYFFVSWLVGGVLYFILEHLWPAICLGGSPKQAGSILDLVSVVVPFLMGYLINKFLINLALKRANQD